MADILIRGIPKPTDCGKCFVGDRTICADGCPLVELPEHGDLIDRGAMLKAMGEGMNGIYDLTDLPEFASYLPIVVPSNKEETE